MSPEQRCLPRLLTPYEYVHSRYGECSIRMTAHTHVLYRGRAALLCHLSPMTRILLLEGDAGAVRSGK